MPYELILDLRPILCSTKINADWRQACRYSGEQVWAVMRVVHSRFGQPTSGVVFPQAPPVVPAQNMDPEEATRLTPDWEREYDYGLQIIVPSLISALCMSLTWFCV